MLDLTTFHCTGCVACYNICPHKAIQMAKDDRGFKFPKIDTAKCTNCGLCEKVCIPSNGYVKQPFDIKSYGVKNKELSERKQSQSGGAFFVFAREVLSRNGVVYGVLMDENLHVRHARATTLQEAESFRGSKYVQSDLGDIFKSVEKDLKSDRYVLFTGTPCQVAGLKSFLRKDYDKLLSIDLICHGVPSESILKAYLSWQKRKNIHKKISNFKFRDTKYHWGAYYESFFLGKQRKVCDVYAKVYASCNTLRESCYNCMFANLNRVSDITIGDFWGIEKVNVAFMDSYGVSSILINSEKGQEFFEALKTEFDYFETNVTTVAEGNPNLKRPTKRPANYEQFWSDYQSGFDVLAKKYADWTLKGRLKLFLKRLLKK